LLDRCTLRKYRGSRFGPHLSGRGTGNPFDSRFDPPAEINDSEIEINDSEIDDSGRGTSMNYHTTIQVLEFNRETEIAVQAEAWIIIHGGF
jgi:hypothetical protein